MRRWIAWTASLLAGAFCFHPGLRMLWFGHGNEPRDEWALYVCMSALSLMRQQYIWPGVLSQSTYSSAL